MKLNAEPIPPDSEPRVGFDAHSGTKNVYVNQTREAIAPNGEQEFPYPEGAIVVKESIRSGKDFIGLVAIMRKVGGSNPSANDWQFEEYTRSTGNEGFGDAIKGAFCANCHAGASDTDYVWTLLE